MPIQRVEHSLGQPTQIQTTILTSHKSYVYINNITSSSVHDVGSWISQYTPDVHASESPQSQQPPPPDANSCIIMWIAVMSNMTQEITWIQLGGWMNLDRTAQLQLNKQSACPFKIFLLMLSLHSHYNNKQSPCSSNTHNMAGFPYIEEGQVLMVYSCSPDQLEC